MEPKRALKSDPVLIILSHRFESYSERIPRGLPRGKRANIIIFILTDRRFRQITAGVLESVSRCISARRTAGPLPSVPVIDDLTEKPLS